MSMPKMVFVFKNNGAKVGTIEPKNCLMELLVKKTREARHQLSLDEASKIPDMFKPDEYASYFGSFERAAKKAWEKIGPDPGEAEQDFEEDGDVVKKPSETLSVSKKATSKRSLKREDVLQAVITFYNMHGRLPRAEECGHKGTNANSIKLPNYKTIQKYLGNKQSDWLEVLKKAGVEISQEGEEKYKRSMGHRYTVSEIEGIFVDFCKRYGRVPTHDDARVYHLPTTNTFLKYLGPKSGWPEIAKKAGVFVELNSHQLRNIGQGSAKKAESEKVVAVESENVAPATPKSATEKFWENTVKELGPADFGMSESESSEQSGSSELSESSESLESSRPSELLGPAEPKKAFVMPYVDSLKVDIRNDGAVAINLTIVLPGRDKPITISTVV